jgi:hypothetical protein
MSDHNSITAAEFRASLQKKGNPKKSKYGNTFTTVNEIKFRSKKEAEYYKKLLVRKQVGDITDFSLQPRFPYRVIYALDLLTEPILEKKGAYVADFKVTYPDERIEYVDTKGAKTKKFLRDIQIVEKLYSIKIKVL